MPSYTNCSVFWFAHYQCGKIGCPMSVVSLTSFQLMEAIRVLAFELPNGECRDLSIECRKPFKYCEDGLDNAIFGWIQFSNQILEWYVKSSLDLTHDIQLHHYPKIYSSKLPRRNKHLHTYTCCYKHLKTPSAPESLRKPRDRTLALINFWE